MPKQIRYQMVMPQWLKVALEQEAQKKEVALAELIKDVLKNYIEQKNRPTSPT